MIQSLWDRCRATDPHQRLVLHRWLFRFWVANFPPVIALYVLVGNDTFQRLMLLYLALVSIWANVASEGAVVQAARVEVKQDEASAKPEPS